MKYPWANTLLLVLIAAELISGFLGLLTSSEDRAVFMQAHRVSGYGILAVLVWKGRNVWFSLRWRRKAAPRTASLVLTALLALTLGLGFAWSFAGPMYLGLFSGVSWHIYVGAALLPLLVWHAVYHTRGFPIGFWAERRSFVRLTGLVAFGVVGWRLGELGAWLGGLSGAGRRFTGSYEARSFSGNAFPLTSWLNDSPEPVAADRWTLAVRGAVERELSLAYGDIGSHAEVVETIDCTGGWYSTQAWRGTPLDDVLAQAGVRPGARSVTVRSVTGYYRRFSLGESRRCLLATRVGGEALSHGHGFPVRLVVPGRRGFEWVKWVESIEVGEAPHWVQPPLPLQ